MTPERPAGDPPLVEPHAARDARRSDAGLSALLAVQILTLFVVVPLGAGTAATGVLLMICHLAFAIVCIVMLTRNRALRISSTAGLVLLAVGPLVARNLSAGLHLDGTSSQQAISAIAFTFIAVLTAIVGRHVFGPGRITAHRIQGAILLYLNVADLFAILFSAIASTDPGAFSHVAGSRVAGERLAEMTYFSFATITTTGYGDIVPVHAVARSLANLESVFGHLFPATLLARLVALHSAREVARDGVISSAE